MNKFSSLINKIKIFSNNAISKYKLLKLAAGMTLADFTDNSIIYNDKSSNDELINKIKSNINTLMEMLTDQAQIIENVISGDDSNKMNLVDAVGEFVSKYDQLQSVLSNLNELPNSYERFMVEEGGNETLDLVRLIDYIQSAYKAVDEAVISFAGVPMDKMTDLMADANAQALETIDPAGDGFGYSDPRASQAKAYETFKENIRMERARENATGSTYTSPLLNSIRQSQQRYLQELKSDPERWKAFKDKVQKSYEKRRGDRRAQFDIVLQKIAYKLLKYNLITESQVSNITPITVHNLLPRLLNVIEDEKELHEVQAIAKEFDNLARTLQFDKGKLQQREDYRAELTKAKSDSESILGAARKYNTTLDAIKSNAGKEVKKTMAPQIADLTVRLQKAVSEGDKEEVKVIKKEIKNMVEGSDSMVTLLNDIKQMKLVAKGATKLLPRGALQSGINKIDPSLYSEAKNVLSLARTTMNAFSSKYNIETSLWNLMYAISIQIENSEETQ